MDTQTNNKKEGEKLNLPHFHINEDYSFYLLDYFFNVDSTVDNHWKHYKKTTTYILPNEITKLIEQSEFDFQVPLDIP